MKPARQRALLHGERPRPHPGSERPLFLAAWLPRFACPPSFGRRGTRHPNEGPIKRSVWAGHVRNLVGLEVIPDGRGGRARPGERGDRRARAGGVQRSHPAGLDLHSSGRRAGLVDGASECAAGLLEGHRFGREPAHATLNVAVWQGEGSAPLRPSWGSRASVGAAEGGVRLRNLVPGRGDGRPAVGEAAISHRGEPVARDPCAPRRRLSGGRGGKPLVSLLVATRSMRSTSGANHGRKSSKVLQDCTICVSCRCTGPCWTVPRKRENRT